MTRSTHVIAEAIAALCTTKKQTVSEIVAAAKLSVSPKSLGKALFRSLGKRFDAGVVCAERCPHRDVWLWWVEAA